ncbi:hypothetical protein C8029_13325 [Roseobacter sp. TSBP12]|nr:hypothetical protein C8029_13325 [Roseobacter sp. TSBP12]
MDSFKSILKSEIRPFLLVLSGIPELDDNIQNFEQLGRKVGKTEPRRLRKSLLCACFSLFCLLLFWISG